MIKSREELSNLMAMYHSLPKESKDLRLIDIKTELMKILNSIRDLEDKISNQLDVMDIDVECDCDESDCPVCSGEESEESELSELYGEILDSISNKDFYKVMLLLVNLTKDIKPASKPEIASETKKKVIRRIVKK